MRVNLLNTLVQQMLIRAPVFVLVLATIDIRAATIPEPGFIMYGAVSNFAEASITSGAVVWHVSSSSSAVSVNPAMINVNGQPFYFATVPFETRSVGGVKIGAPTPNTLPLASTPTTFARLATVNGTNATIVYASSGSTDTFTFGPADRRRIEQVDLAVSPPLTFAQYGLPADSNPNSDPTHKGMTLMQQYLAGTRYGNKSQRLETAERQTLIEDFAVNVNALCQQLSVGLAKLWHQTALKAKSKYADASHNSYPGQQRKPAGRSFINDRQVRSERMGQQDGCEFAIAQPVSGSKVRYLRWWRWRLSFNPCCLAHRFGRWPSLATNNDFVPYFISDATCSKEMAQQIQLPNPRKSNQGRGIRNDDHTFKPAAVSWSSAKSSAV